jgi:HPt (histidine-containing phosphotransfer) domain-containing protein
MSSNKILDWEGVMDRVDNDIDLYFDLIDMFFADYPSSFNTLKESVTNSNSNEIDRKAHSLKSALGNLGAMQAYEAAYKLERAGKSSETANYVNYLKSFEEAVEAFRIAVTEKRITIK